MDTVISLTTIPNRVDHIEPVLVSLLNQKYPLPVYLWIQASVARTNSKLGTLPKFLSKLGGNFHFEIVPERGPITKLLPALERQLADAVITADDDCIYAPMWSKVLRNWVRRLPNAAIGFRGRQLRGPVYEDSKRIRACYIDEPTDVDLFTGVHGALYHSKFFDDSIFGEWKKWVSNDDLVIHSHLRNRNIRRVVVPWKGEFEIAESQKYDGLYESVNLKNNDEGLTVCGW